MAKNAIVLELQHDALRRDVPVSELLRKAFVVARKLGISDFEKWINRELNGYEQASEVPEYRRVRGEVKAWNPYRGWVPVLFESAKLQAAFSRRRNGQPVAEIESLVATGKDTGRLVMPYPEDAEQALRKGMRLDTGAHWDTQVILEVPPTSVIRVLDAVRNVVLNWAIQLEADGILGEGLSFTKEERQAANQISYNVNNFFGAVQGSQIQQQSDHAVQISMRADIDLEQVAQFLSDLKKKRREFGLQDKDQAELDAEIGTVESQIASPKPKESIINESLQSIRSILEGAAGGTAAHLLIQLGAILA